MNIIFWDKAKISQLTEQEQEMWFDVYNDELETDRGINISKLNQMDLIKTQKNIKDEYLKYLNNLVYDKNFQYYTILYNENNIIVSACRLIKRDESIYIGALETHRDYRNLGYGKLVLSETIKKAFQEGESVIQSVIREWNKASIKAHKNVGFRITETKGNSLVLSLGNIRFLSKAIIEDFMGGIIESFQQKSDISGNINHDSYYDFKYKGIRYVAKFKSTSKEKTSQIIDYIKSKQNDNTKLFESRKYGFTHKFHIYGRDFWLWIEAYRA